MAGVRGWGPNKSWSEGDVEKKYGGGNAYQRPEGMVFVD